MHPGRVLFSAASVHRTCSSFIRRRNYTRRFFPHPLEPILSAPKRPIILQEKPCVSVDCVWRALANCFQKRLSKRRFVGGGCDGKAIRLRANLTTLMAAKPILPGDRFCARAGVKYDYFTQFLENDFQQHNSALHTLTWTSRGFSSNCAFEMNGYGKRSVSAAGSHTALPYTVVVWLDLLMFFITKKKSGLWCQSFSLCVLLYVCRNCSLTV